MDLNSIFEIKELNAYYDFSKKSKKQALKDISFSILDKKITALIGPSGCGKSTFIKCLNRMNDLVEDFKLDGKIIFEGKDISSRSLDVIDLRTRVGMIFQKPNPFPMSIFDNIAYGPKCSGIRKKSVLSDLVEKTLKASALWDEVKDRLSDSATGLSGGQQQRLCIARTLAMSPDVILMDEPTSALDPIATGKIEELMEVLKESYTIVIVTHSMQQAARISDNTAFFLLGELVESGRTKTIFANPADKRTQDYVTGRFG